jgi:hypothetical protein
MTYDIADYTDDRQLPPWLLIIIMVILILTCLAAVML